MNRNHKKHCTNVVVVYKYKIHWMKMNDLYPVADYKSL